MFHVDEPVMVIDEKKARGNIKKIVLKTIEAGNIFRPHFKTHQSSTVGEWFKDEGVTSITVSSLKMAEYFADNGWEDILIAFLYIPQSIGRLNRLASRCRISVIADNHTSLKHLAENIEHPIEFWIKVDTGYSRTGIPLNNREEICSLMRLAAETELLNFKGLLTHAGHSYKTSSTRELEELFSWSACRMQETAESIYKDTGIKPALSWGDTPTCSVVEDLSAFDEIRCGNFVFYDLMQFMLKSCSLKEIASVIYCPVAGIYPERNEFVILGGAVHLSKEYVADKNNNRIFGMIGLINSDNSWSEPLPDTWIKSLSQEHGVVTTSKSVLKQLKHGDIVAVYPVHSCLTGNLAEKYLSLSGQVIHNINSTS